MKSDKSYKSFSWSYFNFLCPHCRFWFISFFVSDCRKDRMPRNARDVFNYFPWEMRLKSKSAKTFFERSATRKCSVSYLFHFTLSGWLGHIDLDQIFDLMMPHLLIFPEEWEHQSKQIVSVAWNYIDFFPFLRGSIWFQQHICRGDIHSWWLGEKLLKFVLELEIRMKFRTQLMMVDLPHPYHERRKRTFFRWEFLSVRISNIPISCLDFGHSLDLHYDLSLNDLHAKVVETIKYWIIPSSKK